MEIKNQVNKCIIIAVTAFSDKVDETFALKNGFNGYLHKPI